MSVLMGANVANEVAKGDFAEATVGCTDLAIGAKWVSVFNTPDFKVSTPPNPTLPSPTQPSPAQPNPTQPNPTL